MTEALVPAAAAPAIATGGGGEVVLPQVIVDAGPQATARFLEFFAGRIANARTRAAYGRAVGQFLAWCEARGLGLDAVSPLHVAAYIRTHPGSVPTVKQHLAANPQDRAHPREAVEHHREEHPVSEPGERARIDAVEELPRLGRGQNWRRAFGDDVLRPPHRGRGIRSPPPPGGRGPQRAPARRWPEGMSPSRSAAPLDNHRGTSPPQPVRRRSEESAWKAPAADGVLVKQKGEMSAVR